MKQVFLVFISLTFFTTLSAQNLADSLSHLYQNYLNLQKSTDQLYAQLSQQERDSIALTQLDKDLKNLEKRQEHMNEVLESSSKSLNKISSAQLYTNKVLLDRNKNRIINSTDFVESANVSLNTLKLTKEIFHYTNQITALHSPDNDELGFSMTDRMTEMLEKEIFKNRSKVNKVKKEKFLKIVSGVLSSPITESITSSVPVVGAIKSVVSMVANLTLKGDEVKVEDLNKLKKSLQSYVEYYQGLDQARKNFESKINSIHVRTEALQLLLKNYTSERIAELYPEESSSRIISLSLNEMIEEYYSTKRVDYEVTQILGQHKSGSIIQYERALSDSRMLFHDFAVSQAKFIMDEIESINTIYEAALNSYQDEIEKVLETGKTIGIPIKIDQKIKMLRQSKEAVVKAIKASLNVRKVKNCYQSILGVA